MIPDPLSQLLDAMPPVDEVAVDRDESEACERGTPGCSVHHTSDTPCEPW